MSILQRVIENGQSSRSLVNQMINILKDVEEKYGKTRTFFVVGHSLGQNEHEKVILSDFFCFASLNRRWHDQTGWYSS
jgi:hypothetical protein